MRRNLRIALGVLLVATAASGVRADEDLSIVINPFTGATSIRNDSVVGVTLDSYFINASGAPVLDPVGWNSLEDQAVGEFQESGTPQANRLAELDFFGPGSRSRLSGRSASATPTPRLPRRPSARKSRG